jgi:hypothetical protein
MRSWLFDKVARGAGVAIPEAGRTGVDRRVGRGRLRAWTGPARRVRRCCPRHHRRDRWRHPQKPPTLPTCRLALRLVASCTRRYNRTRDLYWATEAPRPQQATGRSPTQHGATRRSAIGMTTSLNHRGGHERAGRNQLAREASEHRGHHSGINSRTHRRRVGAARADLAVPAESYVGDPASSQLVFSYGTA